MHFMARNKIEISFSTFDTKKILKAGNENVSLTKTFTSLYLKTRAYKKDCIFGYQIPWVPVNCLLYTHVRIAHEEYNFRMLFPS